MSSTAGSSTVDHFLVARAQACANGANAHDLYALLGNYYELCHLAEQDPTAETRIPAVERRLRAFCQTGNVRGCLVDIAI